jgi:hypothetical protein
MGHSLYFGGTLITTMMIGFAGIGFMAYRRKSKPALMAA